MHNTGGLCGLPIELVQEIALYCGIQDLSSLSATCKRLKHTITPQILSRPRFWQCTSDNLLGCIEITFSPSIIRAADVFRIRRLRIQHAACLAFEHWRGDAMLLVVKMNVSICGRVSGTFPALEQWQCMIRAQKNRVLHTHVVGALIDARDALEKHVWAGEFRLVNDWRHLTVVVLSRQELSPASSDISETTIYMPRDQLLINKSVLPLRLQDLLSRAQNAAPSG